MFWMITEAKYDLLRLIEGCNELTDLNATVPDAKFVLEMADGLGIPEANRYIDTSPNFKGLKKTYM